LTKLLANTGLLLALVGAAVTLLTAFGVGITDAQVTAITGLASAVLAVVSAYFSPTVSSFGRTQ
jgi:hypothetical protein